MINEYKCNACKHEQPCVFKTLKMSKPDECPYYNDYLTNWRESKIDDLKSKWKPTKNSGFYYTPEYEFSKWSIRKEPIQLGTIDDKVIAKGEAFKTEAECQRYMNAQGWINEEPWKI